MPTISIIVPVYKSELYLQRCLDSILSQSFTDFELILVDDGSPDKCPEICNWYAQHDHRIYVVHQENSGPACARNTGLDIATGKYIMFCDSDDYVSRYWIEHLYLLSQRYTKSIVLSGISYSPLQIEAPSSESIFQQVVITKDFNSLRLKDCAGYLVNTLFSRKTIDSLNLRFRTLPNKRDYNEDLLFWTTYASSFDTACYIDSSDYCYCARKNSFSYTSGQDNLWYIEKYLEKFQIWTSFFKLRNFNFSIHSIANDTLYHIFLFLHAESSNSVWITPNFRSVISSDSVQSVIKYASAHNENTIQFDLLKKKNYILLWSYFKLSQLKNSFVNYLKKEF